MGQPFTVAGWAIDQGAPSGTGVDLVHVYAVSDWGAGTATRGPTWRLIGLVAR